MCIRLKYSISHLFNCVLFELISGQIHGVILQTSGLNQTYTHLVNKSDNNFLALDILHNNLISLETIANSSVNICDDIDCSKNIVICEQNRCLPSKRMRKNHYIVTCVIVLVIICLMLTSMYACHKETKRINRWNNSCNRADDHIIAIRLVHPLNQNRRFRDRPQICEIIPLTIPNEAPPPYDLGQRTPPPDYREAVQCLNELQNKFQ